MFVLPRVVPPEVSEAGRWNTGRRSEDDVRPLLLAEDLCSCHGSHSVSIKCALCHHNICYHLELPLHICTQLLAESATELLNQSNAMQEGIQGTAGGTPQSRRGVQLPQLQDKQLQAAFPGVSLRLQGDMQLQYCGQCWFPHPLSYMGEHAAPCWAEAVLMLPVQMAADSAEHGSSRWRAEGQSVLHLWPVCRVRHEEPAVRPWPAVQVHPLATALHLSMDQANGLCFHLCCAT